MITLRDREEHSFPSNINSHERKGNDIGQSWKRNCFHLHCLCDCICQLNWIKINLHLTSWHRMGVYTTGNENEIELRVSHEKRHARNQRDMKERKWNKVFHTKRRSETVSVSLFFPLPVFSCLFSTSRYDPIDCYSWRGSFFFLLLFLQNLVQSSFTRSKTRVKGKTEDEGITHITRRDRERMMMMSGEGERQRRSLSANFDHERDEEEWRRRQMIISSAGRRGFLSPGSKRDENVILASMRFWFIDFLVFSLREQHHL